MELWYAALIGFGGGLFGWCAMYWTQVMVVRIKRRRYAVREESAHVHAIVTAYNLSVLKGETVVEATARARKKLNDSERYAGMN